MPGADRPDGSAWSRVRAALRGGFVRRAGGLVFASAASQVVSLFSFILVARLYLPESIGSYVVFSSCATILAPILLLSSEFAIPKAPDDRQLREVTGGLMLLGLVTATLVLAAALGIRYSYAVELAVLCLALAAQRLVGQLNIRFERIAALAAAQLGSAILFFSLILAFSTLGSDGRRLVLAQVVAVSATAALQALDVCRLPGIRGVLRDVRAAELRRTLALHRRFALFVTPSQFFNLATYHLPTILIARWFGNDLAAQYGMGMRLAHAPIQLVGNALNTTYHGRLAKTVRNDRRELGYRDFLSLRRVLIGCGGITALALAIGAPTALSWTVGPNWDTAARIVQLLSPLYGSLIILMPLGVTFLVLGREGTVFASQAAYFGISLVSMIVAVAVDDLLVGIAVFSVFSLVRFVWLFASINKLMRRWRKASAASPLRPGRGLG